MEIKKRLVQFLVIIGKLVGVTLISAAVCVGALYQTLPPMQAELDALKLENTTLQTSLNQHDSDIALLHSQVSTLQRISERLQSTVNMLKESKANMQRQLDSLDKQNQSMTELSQFYEKHIVDLTAKIARLSERAHQVKRLATQQASMKHATKQKSAQHKVINNSPIAHPFTLHSIQTRGSALVAVVSPLDATSLADVSLVKTNDYFLGWHITTIHLDIIEIKKANQTITMQVST
ncbi:hypothetical protein [Shewanella colwelliana]|uniref:hypothetical protein n=1 Tax=Shewanella colwelliana TaxID=23 RepID=UPI003736E8CA